jgi:hypothetical protein
MSCAVQQLTTLLVAPKYVQRDGHAASHGHKLGMWVNRYLLRADCDRVRICEFAGLVAIRALTWGARAVQIGSEQ